MKNTNYSPTKTTKLLDNCNTILYLCGLSNFWIDEVKLPRKFVKIFDIISYLLHLLSIIFTLLQLGAFITQKNLTEKQQGDRLVSNLANCVSLLYCFIFLFYKKEIRNIFYHLAVILKKDHNDLELEEQMITKIYVYVLAYTVSSAMTLVFYGVHGIIQSITSGAPFITIITAWPDVDDESNTAEVARVAIFLYWWILLFRVSGAYLLVVLMLISLSYQYKNLQSYFYSLEEIFTEDLSQTDKENKYEKAFVTGVDMHSKTLWCVDQCKLTYRIVFGIQMLLATSVLISLMPQMMKSDRDFEHILKIIPHFMICLVALAYFMWNAGDISVEASKLPEAMYGSGWPNCYKRSVRIRKLVVIAMTQAQRPIVLKALGFIELSYENHLAIVKTSYSVFSVFY